jgi:hypothetical protein
MFENRIREYLAITEPSAAIVAAFPAFIACPVPLLANYTYSQQSFVAEVYRRAQELTESQLHKPARRLIPEFSLN